MNDRSPRNRCNIDFKLLITKRIANIILLYIVIYCLLRFIKINPGYSTWGIGFIFLYEKLKHLITYNLPLI